MAYMGERRDACRILVQRAERKRPLERHRRRCEDNIKETDIKDIYLEGTDNITLAQDRDKWQALVSTLMNL